MAEACWSVQLIRLRCLIAINTKTNHLPVTPVVECVEQSALGSGVVDELLTETVKLLLKIRS